MDIVMTFKQFTVKHLIWFIIESSEVKAGEIMELEINIGFIWGLAQSTISFDVAKHKVFHLIQF